MIHDYFAVDLALMWTTVSLRLPDLKAQINAIILEAETAATGEDED